MGQQKMSCSVDKSLCNLCGMCVDACPCHSVTLLAEGPEFHCPETCVYNEPAGCCGCVCEEVCPTGALSCAFEIVLG